MTKSGVLLVNLGTPASTDPADIRRYLKRFLSDQRVIDLPKVFWQPILRGMILPNRPKRSAKMYQKIWDEAAFGGSPLLFYTQQEAKALARLLPQYDVRYAMSYSQPLIPETLAAFAKDGIEEITVLPMYPQFSTTTVGSIYDAVAGYYLKKSKIPTLRFVTDFHKDPRYIQILADTLQAQLDAHPETEELVFSYHGIPKRYVTTKKDPYHTQCHVTTELVMERLDHCVPYQMTFQSKFGPGDWLKPATDEVIKALPITGVHNLMVVTPSFIADCLETIYEIDQENRDYFIENGGTNFTFVPPMNDRPEFIEFLAALVTEQGGHKN
ncbi:ferrochelatase [Agrilactobacillus yilanensis]|uniref:Coproporphyrin III ferrochelatase n=1 Tax=Agrilactobacillus yilanensis TaxID=2485997 RepID=A0ABW4J903_9LACO|nr:ferrochelatase [Agrilactobacillus yilanensis]